MSNDLQRIQFDAEDLLTKSGISSVIGSLEDVPVCVEC